MDTRLPHISWFLADWDRSASRCPWAEGSMIDHFQPHVEVFEQARNALRLAMMAVYTQE